jgi:HlyD family secretion protein
VKKWLAAAAILVVASVLLWWTIRQGAVGGTAVRDTLILYGNVDVREVDLAFRVGGRLDKVLPEEGDRVSSGQTLALLDDRPLRDALQSADGRLAIAQAAQAKARAGSRHEEIAQAGARLRQTQAKRDLTAQALERRRALAKSGAISQLELEETEAAYRSAVADVDMADEAEALARAGMRSEDRRATAAQVTAARAERSATATSLDDATLRAPMAGMVVTRAREPGAVVRPGETVLTLAITDPVRVRAYVSESDLSRVAPGMAVWVRADGNPRRYAARISQVAGTAEFTPKTVQTPDLRTDLVYRIRLLIVGRGDGLRQGQPVTILVPPAPTPR